MNAPWTSAIRETPLFFDNGPHRLFGVLHAPGATLPSDTANPPLQGLALVFCHPFAEEKLSSHRVLVNLARHLSEKGAWCLRFDYMGQGDSQGKFEDSNVETMLSDTIAAANLLRSYAGENALIGFLGLRFGATLATLAASRMASIRLLILVAPIVQGKPYIETCLRSNLAAQMTLHGKVLKDRKALVQDLMSDQVVNIDGYLLTKTLYLQMLQVDLLTHPETIPRHVLIVHVARTQGKPIPREILTLQSACSHRGAEAECLDITEEPFWTDTRVYMPKAKSLEQAIVTWLESRLVPMKSDLLPSPTNEPGHR